MSENSGAMSRDVMSRDVKVAIICWGAAWGALVAVGAYFHWALGVFIAAVGAAGIGGIRPLCRIMWLGYADRTLHDDSDKPPSSVG